MIVVGISARRLQSMGDVAADTWPTTGAINTETDSLAISVRQLGQDIFDSNQSTDDPSYFAIQNAWNAFVADFDQWQSAGWFWNPSRRDELVAYRARFNALLGQWKSVPGIATVAAPVAGDAPPPSPLDKIGDVATKLVWIVGIGAAVWAGSTMYKEYKSLRPSR